MVVVTTLYMPYTQQNKVSDVARNIDSLYFGNTTLHSRLCLIAAAAGLCTLGEYYSTTWSSTLLGNTVTVTPMEHTASVFILLGIN